MKLSEKLKKIEIEIQNGHIEKSIRRLDSLINLHPNNIEIRNRMAELYFTSGFITTAGKYWLLTEPINNNISNSIEFYLKSVNHSPTKILKDLKYRGDIDKLANHSASILKDIYKKKKEANLNSKETNSIVSQTKQRNHISISKILIFFLLISIPILIFIGLSTVLKWIF